MNKLPKRHALRLEFYDYNSIGAYFLTICIKNHRKILSNIVGGDVLDAPYVELTQYGKIVDKYINQLNNFYENLEVDSYVIMPNHIHIILVVSEGGASRTSPPTAKQHTFVSQFVSTLKRFCNNEFGKNIFQRSYYDHIIRDKNDYEQVLKYIIENPLKWQFDELYCE